MKNSNKWFSLIEVIIATIILTVWVFGIYKLFWNNLMVLNNNEIFVDQTSLQLPFKECLKNIWYNTLNTYSSWSFLSVNFWSWNMDCTVWVYSSDYTFTPVTLNWVKNFLYAKVVSKDSEKINLEVNIYNESNWNLFSDDSVNKNLSVYK